MTTPIILLVSTEGIVHPPHDSASTDIDINTIAAIAVPIARGSERERRAQIMPVGGTPGIPFRIIRSLNLSGFVAAYNLNHELRISDPVLHCIRFG